MLDGIERAKKADQEINDNIRGNYMGKLGVPGSTAGAHASVQTTDAEKFLYTSGKETEGDPLSKTSKTMETHDTSTSGATEKGGRRLGRHSTQVKVTAFEHSPTRRTELTFGDDANKGTGANNSNLGAYLNSRSSMDVSRLTRLGK